MSKLHGMSKSLRLKTRRAKIDNYFLYFMDYEIKFEFRIFIKSQVGTTFPESVPPFQRHDAGNVESLEN